MATKRVRVEVLAASSGPDPFFIQYGAVIQRAAPDPSSHLRRRIFSIVVLRDLIQPLWDRGYEGCTYLADVPDNDTSPVFDADDFRLV